MEIYSDLDENIKFENEMVFIEEEYISLNLRLYFLEHPKSKGIYKKLVKPMTFMEKVNLWFRELIKPKFNNTKWVVLNNKLEEEPYRELEITE